MKKALFFCTLGVCCLFVLSGCLKTQDQPNQVEVDRNIILDYISTNNLNATEHESGLYHVIEVPGEGAHPTPQDSVEVRYKGYLTDGFVFDQTKNDETRTFLLNGLIPGWKICIPLLKPGGEGTFIIPSYLAYGQASVGPIPPNSVLVFEIELVSIK